MNLFDFLQEPAHPENTITACITPKSGAVSLIPMMNDLEAEDICCINFNHNYYAAMIDKNNKSVIVFYESNDLKSWIKTAVKFQEINNREIQAINFFIYQNDLHLVYCTRQNECCIIRKDSQEFIFVSNLGCNINNASIYADTEGVWLFYGNCVAQKVNDDLSEIYDAPIKIKYDFDSLRGPIAKGKKSSYNYNGNHSPVVKKIDGLYHMFLTDTTDRCYRESKDTYIAVSEKVTGPYSRRYLVLPNGGKVSVFEGLDNEIYISFVGATRNSVVFNKPAIVKLEKTEIGYYKPDTSYIYESGTVDQLTPIGDIELRDTFIFFAPDGKYYLTGTTRREGGTFWSETNGIQIWSSKDLEDWTFVGKVYDYLEKPDNWQNNLNPSKNTWAPEITYFADTFWITYSPNPSCAMLKSATGKIEGPYLDMGRYVTNHIDSGFFIDDDGQVYFIYQNGMIAPLKMDGTGFKKDAVMLMPIDGQQVGYEGAGLIKIMDKYVLYAAEWNGDKRIDGTYDMMYSVSDNLYGPYSPRKILVPHGGHGCLFKDKEGNIRFTMFGNDRTAPFRRGVGIGKVNAKLENGELILWV